MLEHLKILERIVRKRELESRPVSRPISPKSLAEHIDIKLGATGITLEELGIALQQYVEYCPDVSQVSFHKQLYSGCDEAALLGEWVASFSNAVMHTYKMGPVATLMELELIKCLNSLVGFSQGEGIMVSGASQANLIAMMLARHKICPQINTHGHDGRTLVAFVSEQAHYSMQRAANILAIGDNNLIRVKSSADGRMDPADLQQKIQQALKQGSDPFFVGLTAGTTVIGAYDPVKECHAIAAEYNLWLHIDGAWGAPILFSEQNKHLLDGSNMADSFTWDAHKFLNVPLTAGIILVKEQGKMREAISGGGGDYLFHERDFNDPNLGEMSIQSARRADVLKVWSAWKVSGSDAFAQKMNKLIDLRKKFVSMIEDNKKFELLAPTPYLNVLFCFKPSSTSNRAYLNKLSVRICEQLASRGEAFIDYANFKGKVGIRLILANPGLTEEYLSELLYRCEVAAREIISEPALMTNT